MRSVPAISFEPKPSRQLIVASGAGAFLAVVSLLISALQWWLSIPASVAVVLVTLRALRRYRDPRYEAINHDQTGWQLRDRDGSWHAAMLRSHGQLGSWVMLDFVAARSRWSTLLTTDTIDGDTRRRLILVIAATANSVAEPVN
ncbi:MAG: hypothetical protein ABIR16_04930 [Dokdonella sp.]